MTSTYRFLLSVAAFLPATQLVAQQATMTICDTEQQHLNFNIGFTPAQQTAQVLITGFVSVAPYQASLENEWDKFTAQVFEWLAPVQLSEADYQQDLSALASTLHLQDSDDYTIPTWVIQSALESLAWADVPCVTQTVANNSLTWHSEPASWSACSLQPALPWGELTDVTVNSPTFNYIKVARALIAQQLSAAQSSSIGPYDPQVDQAIKLIQFGQANFDLHMVAVALQPGPSNGNPVVTVSLVDRVRIDWPKPLPGPSIYYAFPQSSTRPYLYAGTHDLEFSVELDQPLPGGAQPTDFQFLFPGVGDPQSLMVPITTSLLHPRRITCQIPENAVSGPAGIIDIHTLAPLELATPFPTSPSWLFDFLLIPTP